MKRIKGSKWILTGSNPSVGSIFMYQEVKRLLGLTRVFPEVDGVV